MNIESLCKHILHPTAINNCLTYQVYEEIYQLACFIDTLKPHNILEIGSKGGTFFLFSKLSTGKKIAVDLNPSFAANIHLAMLDEDYYFINKNSQSIETFEEIKSICPKFDFIFIDGDHTYEGVSNDFNLYRNLLSERGYIGFHDIDPDHVFLNIYSDDEPKTGKVRKFWNDLNFGSKTEIVCKKSNGFSCLPQDYSIRQHFGGIGLWKP